MIRTLAAGLLVSAAAGSAFAADLPSRKKMPVAPVEASSSCKETASTAVSADIFGFSGGTDVSDVGAWALGATYGGGYKGAGFNLIFSLLGNRPLSDRHDSAWQKPWGLREGCV